jgi:hypothetical protein
MSKKGPNTSRTMAICHHCHEHGHIERRCPRRRAEGRRLCRGCGKAHGPRCGMKQAEAKQVASAPRADDSASVNGE